MAGLTIGWEYLTGYAVATDPASRERAEWPPHPGRVFMAMAAAHFETYGDSREADALRWLESLDDPHLHLPSMEGISIRSNPVVYVPVNDKVKPASASLQSVPSMTRIKQPRTFPRVYVGNDPCFMHWPDADPSGEQIDSLNQLCAKVTRIGHSSSMVRMWIASEDELIQSASEHYIVDDFQVEYHARMMAVGFLDMLIHQYGEEPRQRKASLEEQIDNLELQRKAVKGKGSQEQKAAIGRQIASFEEELQGIIAAPPVRPKIGLWSGYRRAEVQRTDVDIVHSVFDPDILVLKQVGGPRLPVTSTVSVIKALRDTIMQGSGIQPVPPWVCGHESDGSPLANDEGHLALIPLPFVGNEYADGHLLGVGLVFPRSVERRERGRVLGPLLLDHALCVKQVDIKLGRLGVWSVEKRDWSDRRLALKSETWTAHPCGSDIWASVTPVVLDQFPKADRVKNRINWNLEVADVVKLACVRIGLPEPIAVDIDTTSWHVGSSRAVTKQRLPRGPEYSKTKQTTVFGDGFPSYPAKGANASRPQVHAWLRFDQPVIGPVLLGAGRYMGYGLCKPWKGDYDE